MGWQVDLPGLASLVLNLGASGLKRFAEAGVDFHTILCMGEIAEKCAASNEYRRELSVCRQAQRSESQWLYKLVEIGAATNFVADELLKKRAGENVVALMSAILPVMSESSCDNLLLKLFEACNTPLDKTPGFGQLRSIRKSLTPLARKTQFKDRAFQYHVLSRQLLDIDGSTVNHTAYESIPNEETAVQVILALSRLVQEDSGLILAYHGLRGAGWVIAYARHVLGLPVCVLRSTSKPVPISGDYQSARVLAYLFEQENKCELLSNCNVQELFTTQSLDSSSHSGWSIDVGTTNVLESYIPAVDPLRKGVSVLARSMANSYIEKLAEMVENDPPPDDDFDYLLRDVGNPGLIKYPVYCLPALRKRVTKILSLLGFDPVDRLDLENSDWSEYIRIPEPTPENVQRSEDIPIGSFAPPGLVAGPAWIKSGLGHTQVSSNGQSKDEGWRDALAVYQDTMLDEQGIRHISFLSRIVEAACLLSFADWDQNLRLLSTSFLEDPASWTTNEYVTLIEILMEDESYEVRNVSMTELCKKTIDMCIGGREVWTPDFSEEKMLAFQHHGIIFVQNAAFHQTLDLQSCFVHLLPGAIIADGEERMKIYMKTSTGFTHERRIESSPHLDGQVQEPFKPVDSFPSISFSTQLKTFGESIYLQQDALVQDRIISISSPGSISEALGRLYVTSDCDHRYYDTVTATEIDKIFDKLLLDNGFVTKQGLCLADAGIRSRIIELWLQAVDQNGPGQWLAYQDWNDWTSFTVLQRGCCTACACKMVMDYYRDQELSRFNIACIIPGRFAGEDME